MKQIQPCELGRLLTSWIAPLGSLHAVARRAGRDDQVVGNWISGRRVPHPESLKRFLEALAIPLDDFAPYLDLGLQKPNCKYCGKPPGDSTWSLLRRQGRAGEESGGR